MGDEVRSGSVDGDEEREWVMRLGVRSGSAEWECGWVEEWERRVGVGDKDESEESE